MFCHLGHFFFLFLSWLVCYFKGRSLRCSPGRGNAGSCAVMLYVGEGPRGSNGASSTLHGFSVTPSGTHNQTGPLWCWFPSGWACACPRPLWVSPMTSPVRLGVSPAAAPIPLAFSIRGLWLYFPVLVPWVAWSALLPAICPVYLCANVWPRVLPAALPAPFSATLSAALLVYLRECGAAGSASGQTACPVHPTLHQSRSCHSHMSPLCPGCPSLPLLPVWMYVSFLSIWCRTSLPFDFLSVLVVRGGAVCLLVLSSWFSICKMGVLF